MKTLCRAHQQLVDPEGEHLDAIFTDCVIEELPASGLKLNLAAGTDIRPRPWLNLDVVSQWPSGHRCDLLWDARDGTIPFPDDSISEIYAGYLFLHIEPRFRPAMWAEIYRVLEPMTGILTVGEVDMELAMKRWLANPREKSATEMIWGELGDVHGAELAQFDRHTHGYTEATLREAMEAAGFSHLRRVKIHHADVWYELTLTGVKS
ncbi:MAG TPA: class I SAM-dependent methyltransferase [Terriglobales bacterium]|nr:class I SAM-dependent methyltransferase [Terriglobales bacterium]